jgi:sugar phosphate isomerase/epimerase
VADSNRRLPGRGLTNFAAIAMALKAGGYDGWVTLTCGQPGQNAEFAKHILNELPASIEVLKQAGF